MKNNPMTDIREFTPPASFLQRPAWRGAVCIAALAASMLFAGQSLATVTLPFYDDIPASYTTAQNLGSNGVGNAIWTLGANTTNIAVTTTDAQTYSGLHIPQSGSQGVLVRKIGNINALQNVGLNFNAVSNGTVYTSFLLKVNARPTLGTRAIAGLDGSTSIGLGGVSDVTLTLNTAGQLALGRRSVSTLSSATTALTVGTTYMVVLRYTFVGGTSNDTLDLWLNPASTTFGVSEGSLPAQTIASYVDVTQADATNLQAFQIVKNASGSDPASYSLDEFRIGTNWASVTPPNAVALPFYDGIPSTYANNGSLGTSTAGNANWSLGAPDTNILVSATNAQSYTGLLPPASGSQGILIQKISNENSLQGVGVNFTAVTTNSDGISTNSVYASFLLKVNARPTLSDRCIGTLSSGTVVPGAGNGDLALVLRTSGALAVGRNAVSPISATNTAALTVGTTYLVVIRYNFVPGPTNDTVDLWLNPTNLGVSGSAVPAPIIAGYTNSAQTDPSSLVSFFIPKQASGSDVASWSMDEIRIGTNWASVTPAAIFSNLSASQSISYGTTNLALSGKVSANGSLYPSNGETITIVINGNSQNTTVNDSTGDFSITYNSSTIPYSATPYAITYSYAGNTSLNAASDASTTLAVNQAALSVTANSATKNYDGNPFSGGNGVTYSGFVNGDNSGVLGGSLSYGGTAQGAVQVGTYTIIPSGLTAANYAISYVSNSLTVSPIGLSITANSDSKIYGATKFFAGTEFSTSGLVGSDSVASVSLASSGAASTATVAGSPYPNIPSAAVGTGLGNYNITYHNGSLAVTTASLGITANSSSKVYGATKTFAGTEFTTSGLLNSDSVTTVTLTSSGATQAATVAGSAYSIVPSEAVGTGLGNYNVTYNTGSLTVSPAPLGVLANDTNRAYGATNPVFTATISGFVNGESYTNSDLTGSPSLTTIADTISVVGTYTISATSGTLTSTNYSFSLTNGTLTVSSLEITAIADAKTKVYGAADPALTYTNSPAFVGSDSFSGSLTRASGESVGSYAIGQGTLALSSNYSLTFVGTNLTITPASLSITASNASKVFGQTKTFAGTEFSFSGLLFSDTVSNVTLTSSGAAASAPAASYDIIPSAATGTGLGNYNISYVNGILSVTASTPVTINNPVTLGDGTIQLSFTGGDNGVSYRLQATSDLSTTSWTDLVTNVAGTNGLPGYTDTNATNYTQRYYRTIQP